MWLEMLLAREQEMTFEFHPVLTQPCSQVLSPLLPLSLGKYSGCGWSCDHMWHKRFHRLHLSISHWSERKAIAGHRFIKSHTGKHPCEILLSNSKPQVKRQNIFILHIQRIEVSLWFQFQTVELLKLFCCFKLPELISRQFAKYYDFTMPRDRA